MSCNFELGRNVSRPSVPHGANLSMFGVVLWVPFIALTLLDGWYIGYVQAITCHLLPNLFYNLWLEKTEGKWLTWVYLEDGHFKDVLVVVVVVVSTLFYLCHSMSCCVAYGESNKTNKELGDTIRCVDISRSHSASARRAAERYDCTASAANKRRNTWGEASS